MKKYYLLIFIFVLVMVWSGIHPRRYDHWVGEAAAPILGFIILAATFNKFRFTYFTYLIILFSCILMFIGAHYTFSRVPGFDWLSLITGQERNNFDKFGHVFQGVVPVLIVRELFFIKQIITKQGWLNFIALNVCLATAAIYEIIEYIACDISGKDPSNFLGTQGYHWDSQTDMLAALIGGLLVVGFLSKAHFKLMKKEFPEDFRNEPGHPVG